MEQRVRVLILFLLLIATALPQSNQLFWGMFDDNYISDAERFGAKGDGITDDWYAVQKAIDTKVGQTVYIGKNTQTYFLSKPLHLTSANNGTTIVLKCTLKVANGDSVFLTTNLDSLGNSFEVADASGFQVGQWLGVTDDESVYKNYNRENRYGYTQKIVDITGNQITMALHSPFGCLVSRNARAGLVQSVIILDSCSNITIMGNGVIDGNGRNANQIKIHPVSQFLGEQWWAGIGITARDCNNITIDGLTFKDGEMHNLAFTETDWGQRGCNTISVSNVELYNARMKNILFRGSTNISLSNIYSHNARWEEGIMFYTSNSNATLSNITIHDCGRHGLGINDGNRNISGTNIISYDNSKGISGAYSVQIRSRDISLDTITTDQINISSYGGNTRKVYLSNVNIASSTKAPIINIAGAVDTIGFTNLSISGSSGLAIKIDSANTAPYGGLAKHISFNGGGLFNHGSIWDTVGVSSLSVTDFTSRPFSLQGTMNGDDFELTWTDSTASVEYYIYEDDALIDSSETNSYTVVGVTDIHSYKVRGRNSHYQYSDYSSSVLSPAPMQTEVDAYLTAYGGSISQTQIDNLNTMVYTLKDSLGIASLSQVYDALFVFANEDSVISKIDMINPSRRAVVVDTLTFTQWEGWDGSAKNPAGSNYLNTNFNMSTSSSNFTRNNHGVGIYIRTNVDETSRDFGVLSSSGKGLRLSSRSSNYSYTLSMEDNTQASSNSNSQGYYVIDRGSSTAYTLYKNGVGTNLSTTTNVDLHNLNMFVGCINSNSTPSNFSKRQYAIFCIRKSLTATQNRMENNIFEWYMDQLGKGVQ